MKTFLKHTKKTVLALLFISTATFAQEKVSDAELNSFAKIVTTIQQMNMEAQVAMVDMVEKSDLGMDNFGKYYAAAMTEDQETLAAMSPAEAQEFDGLMSRFEAMNALFDQQIEDAIAKENISLERFEVIATMVDNDEALQAKLMAMLN